jgi:hypothetical protein
MIHTVKLYSWKFETVSLRERYIYIYIYITIMFMLILSQVLVVLYERVDYKVKVESTTGV